MAISYTDYKKKYNENITESQNKYNELRKQQVQNSTTNKTTSTISTTNKLKQEKNNRVQELLKQRQQEISLPTYTETKTSPFNTNFKTDNNKNNMNTVNQQLSKLKNASQNEELKKLVKENAKTSLGETIGKTIGTGSALLTRGGLGALEKFHEFSLNASSNINTFLGEKLGIYTKEQAEKERKSAQELIKRSLKNEAMEKIGWNEDLWQEMEKGSLVKRDNIGGKVIEGIGEMLPTLAVGSSVGTTGNLTKVQRLITSIPTSLTMGVGAYGGSLEQAYNEGATTSQANKYALGSALVETATEWLTGGVPGVNDVGLLDSLEDKTLSKVSNSLAKFLIKNSYNVIGEGTEEALSEIINPILKNATYSQGEKVDWKAVMESAIVGGITGGILNTPANISSYNADVNTAKLKQQQISNQATQNFIEQNNLKPTQINTNEISLPKIDTNREVNVQQNLEKLSAKNNINLPKPTNVDSDIFSKQVDEVVNGTFPERDMLVVSQNTPQVLQNIGLNNLPITMTQKHLNTIMNSSGQYKDANYHDLGIDIVKQLPRTIADPLNVLKSNTKDDSIVVVTDLADNQERPIIASIKIDGKGTVQDVRIDTNVMTSAYGRNNYDQFMQDNIAKGNLLYDIDEGIIKRSDGKLQLQPTTSNEKTSNTRDRVQFPMRGNSFSYDNNTTNSTKSQIAPLPSQYSMQQNVENDTKIPSYKNFSKIMNPNEISQLTMEDANTTPLLPKTKRNNQNANEESSFYKNITEKSKFLTEESRGTIGNEEDVQYYKGITNEDTLNAAKTKLDNGGMSETLNWFNRNKVDSNGKMKHNPTAVDVAEGWILLKQYQDTGDYDSMVEVAKTMREIGTQAGQTVQAYNIMARLTPEGMVKYAQSELSEAYEQMSKNKTKEWIDSNRDKFDLTPQEVQAIVEIMGKVQTMEDGYNKKVELAKIQKIMTDKLPPERGAGIKAWMRISMLFNPKTQVRNVMGNVVIAPVNYFSDLFSSAVDRMVAKKTGYRTTGVTNIGNYVKGFKKGAFESYNDFKEGINTRNIEGNRFEITEGKSFNENHSGILSTPRNLLSKGLNKTDSLLGFMLDVGDRTFYEATFTNSINNQMKLNKTNEVTQEMIDIATQEALSRTWQDNNNYTKFVLDIRKGLNKLNIKGYGLGDLLIPFAKTPANLTKAIVDYSPLGLIQTINDGVNLKKSLSNGQYNAQIQHKFVQDLGKATAGTMLYVLGYALAKAGITSGESDDDKDVANFMKNTLGVSSYSIKIGNKTFTYDWAQPVAAPFAMMSNLVQKQKENASLLENITATLDTGLNVIFEQSFLSSLSDILSEPGEIGSKLGDQLLELPSRAIPTFMKQITDLTDGTQRTTFEKDKPLETAFNKIKAKIPGLSRTLVPTKDTLGRDVKKYGGKNNIFNVFVNPANVNTENISKSAEEIYRVYKATGEKSIMPRVPEYKYKDEDGNEIILNSQQRAEYQEVSGKIIEDNIEKLLNTTEYKKLTDIEKAEILNNIVNYSYNVAKKEVLDLDISQTYAKAYEYSEIGNVSDYYTFKANIDDTDSDTKKESISSYLINSNLNNKQLAYLYGSYYSSEETLNSLLNANIPIKEFIKFNSQKFEGDFNTKTGKTISGSRENKVINYVNSLNLSIPQKALLIKMEYKSFKKYDRQIAEYVNSQNISFLDKAQILKKANFTSFDKQIINYVNSQNMTVAQKTEILKDLGFTIKNGRVYW